LKTLKSSSREHEGEKREPTVSIIIPTKNQYELLHACIESILGKTTYRSFNLIVINNQSKDLSAVSYLSELEHRGVRVLDYPHPFNYSRICNLGAAESSSDFLCFLNNDTEVIDPDWLSNLMAHATGPSVGVVGSKLLYPDGTIQHFGVALGYKGVAGHVFSGVVPESEVLGVAQGECFQVSAVTFACAVTPRRVFMELGGLDEEFVVGLNDIDFCIRASKAGYSVIMCSRNSLIHHESKTRSVAKSLKGLRVAVRETLVFAAKYRDDIKSDVFFGR
jgi:GT2 family glycosyltransferase